MGRGGDGSAPTEWLLPWLQGGSDSTIHAPSDVGGQRTSDFLTSRWEAGSGGVGGDGLPTTCGARGPAPCFALSVRWPLWKSMHAEGCSKELAPRHPASERGGAEGSEVGCTPQPADITLTHGLSRNSWSTGREPTVEKAEDLDAFLFRKNIPNVGPGGPFR